MEMIYLSSGDNNGYHFLGAYHVPSVVQNTQLTQILSVPCSRMLIWLFQCPPGIWQRLQSLRTIGARLSMQNRFYHHHPSPTPRPCKRKWKIHQRELGRKPSLESSVLCCPLPFFPLPTPKALPTRWTPQRGRPDTFSMLRHSILFYRIVLHCPWMDFWVHSLSCPFQILTSPISKH